MHFVDLGETEACVPLPLIPARVLGTFEQVKGQGLLAQCQLWLVSVERVADTMIVAQIPESEKQHTWLDRAAAICHQDGILHMTSLDVTDRILLTASHDGVVKAWK